MKKIILLLIFFSCNIALFAQKDTLFFLYRGGMYPPHDTTLNSGIKKKVNWNNGDVIFEIAGMNGTNHSLMYSTILSKKEFMSLNRILLSKKVYYLNSLALLDEKSFIKKLGLLGYEYSRKHTVVYLVPLLDMGVCKWPTFEVLFVSDFLAPDQ